MTEQEQAERWYYEGLIARSIFALGLAVLALVLGWFGFGNIECLPAGDWFAKSGAFATVAALWANRAEAQFVARYCHTGGGSVTLWKLQPEATKVWAPRLSVLNMAVAIAAALVWGYGDVIYRVVAKA